MLFESVRRHTEKRRHGDTLDAVEHGKGAALATCKVRAATHDVSVGEDEGFILAFDDCLGAELFLDIGRQEVLISK